MLKALLLDLDNTLLGIDMDAFLRRYFALLSQHVEKGFPGRGKSFSKDMRRAMQQVIANTRPELTNGELFWQAMGEGGEFAWGKAAERHVDLFYPGSYQQLQEVTTVRPAAAELIEWAFAQGLQVVIATNPLYPQAGIEARLAWAGVPVDKYPYALVTHFNNVHSTKPRTAYYREILQKIGCEARAGLMVGDDWGNDMVPAAAVGLSTFWIAPEEKRPSEPAVVDGYGGLGEVYERLKDGWLFL